MEGHIERKMKCMYCQTEMKRGSVPFHIDRKGVHVSLDEIPAWLCSQCGETYFEEKELDSMQALVKAIKEQTQKFSKIA